MSKARVIGAGSAGSTIFNCNVNLNTAGGNKKQGLPFQLDRRTFQHRTVKTKATGDKRDYIFTMNQLGGVGRVGWYPRDGIQPRDPYKYGDTTTTTTTITTTINTLTCDIGLVSENYNTFLYTINNISYILFSSLSCDPSTIKIISINDGGDNITMTNVTYLPNGPKNNHEGYVFEIEDINGGNTALYTTNTCSTQTTKTLLISNGSTDITLVNNMFVFYGEICPFIEKINYNGVTYDVIIQVRILNNNTIVNQIFINGTINDVDFQGSLQCI